MILEMFDALTCDLPMSSLAKSCHRHPLVQVSLLVKCVRETATADADPCIVSNLPRWRSGMLMSIAHNS